MKIAVVILNWNGKALLEQFLPSIVQYSEQAKIYVADNASTDESVAFLRKNYPEIEIIENGENLGYAGGYNLALKSVPEEFQVLLNSDVEVTAGWLEPILRTFENEPKVAAIQPKILDFKKKDFFEYAGAAGGFIDKYGYPYCKGRIFQKLEKDLGQYDLDNYIFWATGACLAVRRSVFEAVGGFDEDFFAHQEEIDLCWRMQNQGNLIKYVSGSKIFHVGGATLQEMNPRKTFYNFRNGLFLILKNVKAPSVYLVLFIRMILDGVAAFKFLFEGKPNHFFAVLKAHGDFYKNFGKMLKKRPKQFRISKYYEIKSIVYAHFIQNKNKYTQLQK